MTEISLSLILKKAESVLSTELDGAVILLSVKTNEYQELNGPAGAIWERLDGTAELGAILSDLQAIYDVSEAQCFTDASVFLNKAIDDGLVEVVSQ